MRNFEKIYEQYKFDKEESRRIFSNKDAFDEYLKISESLTSEAQKVVVIKPYDKDDPDIVLDKNTFSQFIIGLDKLDVLEPEDIDAAIANECLIDLGTNIGVEFNEDKTLDYIRLFYMKTTITDQSKNTKLIKNFQTKSAEYRDLIWSSSYMKAGALITGASV